METPPSETAVRRSTRSALAEIPSRMGALSVTENTRDATPSGRNNNIHQTNINPLVELNLPASYLTPSPSPDELVIQQRGRRRLPVTWSPDIDFQKREGHGVSRDRTPVKHQGGSPSKSTIVLRSTPRKRLLLNDPLDLGSPEKRKMGSPNTKKTRLEILPPVFDGPVDLVLKALTSEQLIGVIQKCIIKFPELEQDIKEMLPAPDLRPLEDRLNYLKKNIFKSLPSSRLTGRTDSPAYSRAATHLLAFKKCLVEQGRTLVDSQQWGAVLDYVVMAWNYARATPVWDNPPHNTPRRSCFKTLAAQCMTALKGGKFPTEFTDDLYTKLKGFLEDCDDIQACLHHLESLKQRH
ncbi:uncharacterized protein LOC142331380 [Lycorma delicatula]|uniref:uncharacterized protein LOC142331380 n=1 Tax=Lycorma delicatula TaxID=130591 RepID=UPI003F50F742